MSGPDLRTELERIASSAPVAHVPGDTFARGRRARRRSLALAAGGVAVAIALVAGSALWLPSRDQAPIASGGSSLGVPDHLYAVPTHVDANPDLESPALGVRGAAAWLTENGVPVVVDAVTGGYHLLDLPDVPMSIDLMGPFSGEPRPIALDPSGEHLAYGYGDDSGAANGVRVVDLMTGDPVEVPLSVEALVQVIDVSWSPDGQWLLWQGLRWDNQRANRQSLEVAGRFRLDAPVSDQVAVPKDVNHALAIRDNGDVAVLSTNRLRVVPERSDSFVPFLGDDATVRPGRMAATAVFDPTGRRILLGVGSDGPEGVPALGTVGGVATLGAKANQRVRTYALNGFQSTSEAAGWVEGAPLVAVRDDDDHATGRLLLLDPRQEPRTVLTADFPLPLTLSVATDLMTVARPTVSRPEPDWPWSPERMAVLISLTVGLVLLVASCWVVGRRRDPEHVLSDRPVGRDLAAGLAVGVALNLVWAMGLLRLTGLDQDPELVAYLTLPVAAIAVGLAALVDRWWRARGLGLAISTPLTVVGLLVWFALT